MVRRATFGIRGAVLGVAATAAVVAVASWTVSDLRREGRQTATPRQAHPSEDAAERIDGVQGLCDAVGDAAGELEDMAASAIDRGRRIAEREAVRDAVQRSDAALLEQLGERELDSAGVLDAVIFVGGSGRLLATAGIEEMPVVDESSGRLGLGADDGKDVRVTVLAADEFRWSEGTPCPAIAFVLPVEGSGRAGTEGMLIACIRLDCIRRAVDSHESRGIELVLVDEHGAPLVDDPSPGRSIEAGAMKGLVAGLGGGGVRASTVHAADAIAHGCSVPWRPVPGRPRIFVAGIADAGAIAAELGHARLVSAATVASIGALGFLAIGLLVQSRSQRRAQASLVNARNDADAASRSKTEFLANMSHEIRTPMTAILGYVDLLADHGDLQPGAPTREEAVDTIRRNARHLLSLINDILDLSKIEAGQMTLDRQRVRTLDLVHDALRLMDDRARQKGIALRLALDGEVPETISTDPTRLRQVLINLLGNAVKFTEQGSVTLTVRRRPPLGRTLEFEVADTGIGMTEEQLARLYQPFVQADSSTTRRYGGSGLGLAITRRCVDMLGGSIRARSALGEGSAFSFTVDAGDLSGAIPAKLRPAGTDAPGGPFQLPASVRQPLAGVRILVAEDGIDNQRLLRFHLERAGARVDIVDNGAKAVERMMDASRLDRYDAVLMDMQMPVMDGYEAARRLVAAGERTPILALTAHAMPGDRDRCMEAGCGDYLCKPVDPRALVAAVRQAITPAATAITDIRSPGTDPAPRAAAG